MALISKQARGIGFIGVLVASAILGVVALGVLKVNEMSMRVGKRSDTNLEVRFLVKEIANLFANPDNCTLNLTGLDPSRALFSSTEIIRYDPADTTYAANPTTPRIYPDRDRQRVFEINRNYGKSSVRLQELKLNSNHEDNLDASNNPISGRTILEIKLNRNSRSASDPNAILGGDVITYPLAIRFAPRVDGMIATCRAEGGSHIEEHDNFAGGQPVIPIGAVMAFNLTACPDGWTEADGTVHPSAGPLPDLRGRFIRGQNLNAPANVADNRDPTTRNVRDLQGDELGSHAHRYDDLISNTRGGFSGGGSRTGRANNGSQLRVTNNFGGPETRPVNVALRYCVYVGN